MGVFVTVLFAFGAEVFVDLPDVRFFEDLQDFFLLNLFYFLRCLTYHRLTSCTKTLFNAVPVHDGSIQSHHIHPLIYAGMFQIRRMKKLFY